MTSACALSLLLVLMASLCTVHAQWAQTIGWGGAGLGKRASLLDSHFLRLFPRHSDPRDGVGAVSSSSTRQSSTQDFQQCLVDSNVMKMIKDIIAVRQFHTHTHTHIYLIPPPPSPFSVCRLSPCLCLPLCLSVSLCSPLSHWCV